MTFERSGGEGDHGSKYSEVNGHQKGLVDQDESCLNADCFRYVICKYMIGVVSKAPLVPPFPRERTFIPGRDME